MPKILVIDDDPLVRSTVARILRHRGYEAILAEDGHKGLKLFQSEAPDLVITDIIMPDREGIETIREMRAVRADVKIIAISGGGRLGNLDLLAMAGKLGADEIVAKPFDAAELVAPVTRCLGAAA
jgi:two-component system, chemotaxis family, chemotaxis protein CheY